MNNNLTNERSIRDVFSTTSYITHGEKDKPLAYEVPTVPSQWYLPGTKQPHRANFAGKQFVTNPPKQGRVPEAYLQKEYPWISDTDKYVDRMGYKALQPEKKKGFNIGDFRRRDEFTQNFRQEQYREFVKSEQQSCQKDDTRRKSAGLFPPIPGAGPRPVKPLFDLMDREEEGFPMKCSRDTKNPTTVSLDRDYGNYKTSSQQVGYGINRAEHTKPTHARIPYVKSTFYRSQGVGLPGGR